MKILVVTGWDRSGSTLVANAIGSLDDAVAVGEIVNIWDRGFDDDRPCGCGEPFSSCEFWAPVVETAYGDGSSAVGDRARQHAWIGNLWLVRRQIPFLRRWARDRDRPYRDLIEPLFRSIADHSRAGLVVDASKTPWHTASVSYLAREHDELHGDIRDGIQDDIEVFVLHVVRDPRAVAYSLSKSVAYDGDDDLLMDRHGPAMSTLAWIYRNRLTEWVWGRSHRYLRLRYEDFVADPAAAVARIADFAGIEGRLALTAPRTIDMPASHSVSGNPMRFRHGEVAVRLDDEWRTGLSPRTKRLVRLIASGHLRHYGYR